MMSIPQVPGFSPFLISLDTDLNEVTHGVKTLLDTESEPMRISELHISVGISTLVTGLQSYHTVTGC